MGQNHPANGEMENRLAAIPPIVDTPNLATPVVAKPETGPDMGATSEATSAKTGKDDIKASGIAPGSLESQIASGQINEADLRLVIEADKGTYIYKTINRVTGETLAQYPREDVVKMRDASDYTAGKVVNAKV